MPEPGEVVFLSSGDRIEGCDGVVYAVAHDEATCRAMLRGAYELIRSTGKGLVLPERLLRRFGFLRGDD